MPDEPKNPWVTAKPKQERSFGWVSPAPKREPVGLGGWEAKASGKTAEQLQALTGNGTLPVLVREYESNDRGVAQLQREATILEQHGYTATTQSEDGGHIHVGRLLLTGGLSIFAGRRGIRSKGNLKVTYRRSAPPPTPAASATPDIPDQLRKLGELRDAGILTTEEFEAKKAELLARL